MTDALQNLRSAILEGEEVWATDIAENPDLELYEVSISLRDAKEIESCIEDTFYLRPEIGTIIVSGWQPIETAPKDGSTILGAYADKVLTVRWEPDGYENRGGKPAWIDGSFDRSEQFYVHPLTHWMPLPIPPSAPKQEG